MEKIKEFLENIQENKIPATLKQGLQFKKYQKKITQDTRDLQIFNDLEKNTNVINNKNGDLYKKSIIEGFATTSDSTISQSIAGTGTYSQEISSKLLELNDLETQYKSLLQRYQTAKDNVLTSTSNYMTNVSADSNKYLNQNVKTSDGKQYYMTSEGLAKPYNNTTEYGDIAGLNNCPSAKVPITSLPSGINIGTPMVKGQSCGNEGKNVFVNRTVSNRKSKALGCYKDSKTSPAMTALDKGSQSYNYSTCQQAAIDSGNTYFGLQNLDEKTNLSSCYVSNEYEKAIQYGDNGEACNTGTDDKYYGGDGVNAIYSRPPTAKYVGVYKDKPDRAMTVLNDGVNTYTYESCRQAALNNNSTFFGLQDFDEKTQTAMCSISDNISESTKYETSDVYTTGNDKKKYGGEWTNVIYQIEKVKSNYLGCYNDKESSPAMSPVGDGVSNYSYESCMNYAVLRGNKYFALQGGTVGTSKCFVSNDETKATKYGKYKPCIQNTKGDKKTYGSLGNNALYEITELGDLNSVGNMGYVDADTKLTQYPDNMLTPGKKYTIFKDYSSDSKTLGNPITGKTVKEIIRTCNANKSCYGFVYDNSSKTAYLKGKDIFNPSLKKPVKNYNLYIRNLEVINSDLSCKRKTVNIDSVQWKNYTKNSGYMTPTTTCGLTDSISDPVSKVNDLQKEISATATKIIGILNSLKNQTSSIQNQSGINSEMIDENLKTYNDVVNQINNYVSDETNVNNILKDNELRALQQNYNYMFWTILAISGVIISMNLMKI